ncbi:MAG: hypothetical protein ALECFALPRED_007152 [Alectoria fallacina]|uniref:Uncharacterized protein n=1 Tax=Alectoria fallacina TaxID=1903189 RepID=A0A8H3G642_9LECA|nr:MAG: hypothetical protein ALECFALPRED_007152 [Alectoria fallacina]
MAEYHLLQNKEHDEEVATPSGIDTGTVNPKLWKWTTAMAGFLCGCVFTIVSLVAGHHALSNETTFAGDVSFLTPPGLISKDFTLDERFRLKPSPESDEAWRSILPDGLGVVQHPAIGPEIVSLAFVHQLHCLDIIRQDYFAAQDCTTTSETNKHVVHCLDYVRQALQCHADTNLEFRVVSGTGDAAFTGYSGHRCRDFDRVFRFAETWRVYDGKNASERIKISEEETIPGRVINYDYVSSRGDPVPQ